jgi:hypothetical protein
VSETTEKGGHVDYSDPDHQVWRKSIASGGDNCVEVAFARDHLLLRDSKDPDGPRLRLTRTQWAAFLEGIKVGTFDR